MLGSLGMEEKDSWELFRAAMGVYFYRKALPKFPRLRAGWYSRFPHFWEALIPHPGRAVEGGSVEGRVWARGQHSIANTAMLKSTGLSRNSAHESRMSAALGTLLLRRFLVEGIDILSAGFAEQQRRVVGGESQRRPVTSDSIAAGPSLLLDRAEPTHRTRSRAMNGASGGERAACYG
jgi:hypothetical protein